jgi:hypothetical protein
MRTFVLLASALFFATLSFAQTDTSGSQSDTIRVGGMIIIKKAGKDGKDITVSNRHRNRSSNLSTNWWIVDLGFANWNDKTNYLAAQQSGFITPAIGSKDNLKLRTGKSVNVNIWAFMQKLNLAKS